LNQHRNDADNDAKAIYKGILIKGLGSQGEGPISLHYQGVEQHGILSISKITEVCLPVLGYL